MAILNTASIHNAAAQAFSQFAKVVATGGEFEPGIADADNRFALVLGYAQVFHPAGIHKTIFVLGAKPLAKPQDGAQRGKGFYLIIIAHTGYILIRAIS